MSTSRGGLSLWILALTLLLPLSAQVDTGSMSGVVRDPSGAVIPFASIKITDLETSNAVTAKADDSGFFSVPDLKPGVYSISAGASGFETLSKTGITLRLQDRLSVDFDLVLGQARTSIEIVGRTPLLEKETSSLGRTVEGPEIRALPLNGRSYSTLALLSAGTLASRRTGERNTFIANGTRSVQNSYLLDGVDNKNKIVGYDNATAQSIEPVIDALQEFKVQTGAFSAEFGQSAGAVVNVSIRSGSNRFHGSLFAFSRNSYFDAKPYFQPAGAANPKLNQNQFGATLGGPIIRNKTFFFFAWQSSRIVNAAPQVANVPTAANLKGQFSVPIFDPATTRMKADGSYVRSNFPNNQIPASRFDPVAARLLSLYPSPNVSGRGANFVSNQKERVDNDQFVSRVDHRFGDRDQLFGRYLTSDSTNSLPAPLPPPANSFIEVAPVAHSFAASETHIFKANLVNEVRIGYQETQIIQDINGPRLFEQYGILGAPQIDSVKGLPTIAISGFAVLGTASPGNVPTPAEGSGNVPSNKEGRTIQASENLAWVHGHHTRKFGFDFQQVTLYANSTAQARPAFSFTGVYTQNPENPNAGGAAFADFLLGLTSSSQVSNRSVSELRQHIFQGFFQDDWNATSKLSFNLGLRYELPMPFYETRDNYANLILEPGRFYGTLLDAHSLAGTGYRNSFSDPNWHNFAPRVGLAYQAAKDTVIRSAFGIFYGRDENIGVARRPVSNPPYLNQSNFTSDQIDRSIVLSTGFAPGATDPLKLEAPAVVSYPKRAPAPYVQQWNLNIQREFRGGVVAQISYVGSSSHDLYYPLQIDVPSPGKGPVQKRRPFPLYSAISVYGPYISSNYESLQAKVEHRFSKGLNLFAAYTWGHSIDNGSSGSDIDVAPQNPRNLSAERSTSNFDVRHRFVLSVLYELPFGARKPFGNRARWSRLALGGWQVSGILNAQTGLPFTPVLSFDNTNSGIANARPNRIATGSLAEDRRDPQHWFDTSAFVTPARFTYGNSGRDILRGPSYHTIDFALSRYFRLKERAALESRAEAFNLFNTPQFGLPNPVLGVATTGVISGAAVPQRQLQIALRLSF